MKLIDKDKIVAELEKRYEYWREKEFNSHSIESEIRMSECQHLMLLLNTIKTKEVNLEKDVNEIIKTAEDHAYFAGSENTREKLIDKACKWLRKELVNFEDYSGMGEELISDFRKVMEE